MPRNYQHKNVKLVYDPLWGIVDITKFLPMVDAAPFQTLGFKRQLGITNLLFPAATHTRKEHSFGVFKRAQILADKWMHKGFISEEEARLVEAYALWHDIGHGPFSHLIEPITEELWGTNHNMHGLEVVREEREAIENAGIPFEKLEPFFEKKYPLYKAVSHKNLGVDKFDYLARDAYYTIGEKPGIEYLGEHIYFIDDEVVVDEKAIDNAKALQDFYIKMYKTVYLRKNASIAQRMVQKMIYELLKHESIEEKEFWALTDFGLMGRMENSEMPEIKEQMQNLIKRNLPRTSIALKLEQFAEIERRKGKSQTVLGITTEQMDKLLTSDVFKKPSKLEEAEKEVEKIANLPPNSVLVVPPSSMTRFRPEDISIYTPGGDIAKLSAYFAEHFHAIEEEGKSYSTLRICTFQNHRAELSKPDTAEKIKEYILSIT